MPIEQQVLDLDDERSAALNHCSIRLAIFHYARYPLKYNLIVLSGAHSYRLT